MLFIYFAALLRIVTPFGHFHFHFHLSSLLHYTSYGHPLSADVVVCLRDRPVYTWQNANSMPSPKSRRKIIIDLVNVNVQTELFV